MAAAGTRAALAAERAERDALTLAAAALERALPELGSASSSAEGGSSSSLASRKGSGSSERPTAQKTINERIPPMSCKI